MRICYQTVIWGRRIDDLEMVFSQLEAIGYEGIEFAQAPSELYVRCGVDSPASRPVRDIRELLDLARKHNIEVLGFAGGTLEERIAFCGDYRPPFLYMDSWEGAELALQQNPPFTLAVHPHLFMPIRSMNRVDEIMESIPPEQRQYIKFLPDTAHLTIVEDDPAKAILKYKDRLAAIHFKDWQPHYGRYSHRYARGFVPLGQGIVAWHPQSRPGEPGALPPPGRQNDASGVLETLREIGYDGWIVAELDSSPNEPIEGALASAEWLAEQGLMNPPDRARLRQCSSRAQQPPRKPVCPLHLELRFLQVLLESNGKGLQAFYDSVTDAFSQILPSQLVKLWIFSPEDSQLYLLSAKGMSHVSHLKNLNSTTGCIGRVAREMRPSDFDLRLPENFGTFEDKTLLAALDPKRVLSIPILNRANAHHLRYVVNIVPKNGAPDIDLEALSHLGEHVALFADCVMDELCAAAGGKTSYECGQSQNRRELMDNLRRLLLTTFSCEGAQIFLVNDGRDRLEEACPGVTEWTVPVGRRFYRKGDGLTGEAWQARDMLFSMNTGEDSRANNWSCEAGLSDRREGVFATMARRGEEVLGIIRLTNKQANPNSTCSTMFNDDDAAVLDSIIQAALPHLALFQANERQLKALGQMTHEFQGPIVAIRGAVQIMQESIREHDWSAKQLFGQDYLDDVWNWTDLLIAQVDGANIFRLAQRGITPKVSRTLLLRDVIAPAIHQVHLLLLEREFSPYRICYGTFDDIPPLWVDRNQFRQVIFNMLSNAIKYAQDTTTWAHSRVFGD
jgi:sugar phosphate isomerase/epimerase